MNNCSLQEWAKHTPLNALLSNSAPAICRTGILSWNRERAFSASLRHNWTRSQGRYWRTRAPIYEGGKWNRAQYVLDTSLRDFIQDWSSAWKEMQGHRLETEILQSWDSVAGLLILHCKIKHLCGFTPAFHQSFHELPFLKDTPSGPSSKVEFPSSDKFDCQFTNSIATCEAKDVIPVTVSVGVCVSLDMNCSTFFCKE